jgi:hypothetical protein
MENPRVLASVQRRMFSEKFRNFVDLCVQRNFGLRPSASQLLQHTYLKKMKLQNCFSLLHCSILENGIVEVQRKSNKNQNLMKDIKQSSNNIINNNNNNFNSSIEWNF